MSETKFPNNFPVESELTSTPETDEELEIISMRADLSSDEDHISPESIDSLDYPETSASEDAEVSLETQLAENGVLEAHFPEKISLDSFSRNTDWFNLARKLRQHNRELVKTVVQLEQALAESQEALQNQLMRSRSTETLLAQQSEELNNAQEQITRLFRELEASHQTGQRQQVLIENLSEQFQESQEHIAQLEQEYYLTQEALSQKSQKLEEAEKQTYNLRERLYQQEQQTLQYKSALEALEALEIKAKPPSQPLSQPLETKRKTEETVVPLRANFNSPTPIKPWSSPDSQVPDALKLKLNLKNQEIPPEPPKTAVNSPLPKPVRLPIEPLEERPKPVKPSQPLIQEYPTKPVKPTKASFQLKEEPSNTVAFPLGQEADSDLITATEELLAEVLEASQEPITDYITQEGENIPESIDENHPENFDQWASFTLLEHPEMEYESNYPSPTISVPRRTKKTKSRATVDLPSFLH
jgi:hypothetical protein